MMTSSEKIRPLRESTLQTWCVDYCTKHQILVLNVHQGGWTGKGFPDLLLCLNGRFVAVELKTPIGQLSEAQKVWKHRILKAGGVYACCRTMKEFLEVISHES